MENNVTKAVAPVLSWPFTQFRRMFKLPPGLCGELLSKDAQITLALMAAFSEHNA